MGLLDLFSKKASPSKIDKATKRMLNEHHQQQVRQESMDELIGYGTPEAIRALVQRLGVNFRDTIVNEREKRYVADTLVEKFGDQAIGPLKDFIAEGQAVSAAIRALARLVDDDRLVEVLLETLQRHDPKDHRTINARLQIVDALADLGDPRIVPVLVPYLKDHDDDVRIKVVETLEAKADPAHPSRPAVDAALVELLRDPEIGNRIRRRTADAIVTLGIRVGVPAEELAPFLPDGYGVDEAGRLTRR